jgi:hypothetical protein
MYVCMYVCACVCVCAHLSRKVCATFLESHSVWLRAMSTCRSRPRPSQSSRPIFQADHPSQSSESVICVSHPSQSSESVNHACHRSRLEPGQLFRVRVSHPPSRPFCDSRSATPTRRQCPSQRPVPCTVHRGGYTAHIRPPAPPPHPNHSGHRAPVARPTQASGPSHLSALSFRAGLLG